MVAGLRPKTGRERARRLRPLPDARLAVAGEFEAPTANHAMTAARFRVKL